MSGLPKMKTLPRHPGDALRLVAGAAILLVCLLTVRPDEDLERVLDFIARIRPALDEIERRLPPETQA